jgi:hypothetical protein
MILAQITSMHPRPQGHAQGWHAQGNSRTQSPSYVRSTEREEGPGLLYLE